MLSSGRTYLGAYEVFKTSQVELSNTLAAELEQTKVIACPIGRVSLNRYSPKTIENSPLYGKSVEEFCSMSENVLLTAGGCAGFAASVALAEQ